MPTFKLLSETEPFYSNSFIKRYPSLEELDKMNITKKDIKDDVIKNFLENDNKGIATIKVVKNSVIGYSGCGSCYAEIARLSPEDTIIVDKIKKSENSNSYFGRVRNILSKDNFLSRTYAKDVWISLSSSNIQFIEYQKFVESEYKKLVGISKT